MAYLMVIFEVADDPKTVDSLDAAECLFEPKKDPRIVDAMWDPVIQRRRDPLRKRWLTEFQECFED